MHTNYIKIKQLKHTHEIQQKINLAIGRVKTTLKATNVCTPMSLEKLVKE